MSSWKRVLTTDDLDSVTNTNLATSNLSQTSSTRTYTLPLNISGSNLIFEGNCNGSDENLLRIVADANSASQGNSYVYSPSFRIGSFSLTGAQNSNGYSLPQYSSAVGAGEIMVSSNFGSSTGSVSFKTFGAVLDPATGAGLSSNSYLSANSVSYGSDSYLIYDQTGSGGLRHIRPYELRAPQLFHFGSTATGQTVTMRGVNGVVHDVTNNGVTIPKAMTLASLSFSLKKTDSGTGTGKFEIWRNGSKYMETSTVVNGAELSNNEYVHSATQFTANSGLQSPKVFAEGDFVAVRIVKSGTCGTGAHQVTLRFI